MNLITQLLLSRALPPYREPEWEKRVLSRRNRVFHIQARTRAVCLPYMDHVMTRHAFFLHTAFTVDQLLHVLNGYIKTAPSCCFFST